MHFCLYVDACGIIVCVASSANPRFPLNTDGQTASGKTFTISGPAQATPDQYGVIQRVALQIMDHVTASTKPGEVEFQVKISYLEIYQEKLVDLLAGESEQGELKIRQGTMCWGHICMSMRDHNKLHFCRCGHWSLCARHYGTRGRGTQRHYDGSCHRFQESHGGVCFDAARKNGNI